MNPRHKIQVRKLSFLTPLKLQAELLSFRTHASVLLDWNYLGNYLH